MAERAWDRTVAIAAPSTPSPRRKIRIGSRMILVPAPMMTVVMPTVEYPCALIKGFMPVAIMEKILPSR